jgi:hypothetical protein
MNVCIMRRWPHLHLSHCTVTQYSFPSINEELDVALIKHGLNTMEMRQGADGQILCRWQKVGPSAQTASTPAHETSCRHSFVVGTSA